ncbi:MAG: S-adenosyl-L-methionine-dependent methyltransferase, partial [Monoraphidium minutum]
MAAVADAPSTAPVEREVQLNYWKEHSKEPTVEAMMLDSKASEIDQLERPEVLSTLGCIKGKRVLELGAGIGRFTGEIAKTAKSVLACDFMDVSIEENRRRNGHLPNCDFRVADVTTLALEPGSFDVVFSNWLLMYLSDEEVEALMTRALGWLSEGGVLFFRESCFRPSGDKSRRANPTHYRNPRQYFSIVDEAEVDLGGGSLTHFELDLCKCVDTYVTVKRNQNQICWRWRKVTRSSPRAPLFRTFLDQQQYSNESITRYEAVFGAGYVSTGGESTTRELVAMLGLQPGQRVLDIGCGIGGGDFYMADNFGVHVHAMD